MCPFLQGMMEIKKQKRENEKKSRFKAQKNRSLFFEEAALFSGGCTKREGIRKSRGGRREKESGPTYPSSGGQGPV